MRVKNLLVIFGLVLFFARLATEVFPDSLSALKLLAHSSYMSGDSDPRDWALGRTLET